MPWIILTVKNCNKMILLSADQNSESQQSVATRKRQQRPSQRQQPLDGPRPRQDQQNSQR